MIDGTKKEKEQFEGLKEIKGKKRALQTTEKWLIDK